VPFSAIIKFYITELITVMTFTAGARVEEEEEEEEDGASGCSIWHLVHTSLACIATGLPDYYY
jgi:hypothetical protein